MHNANNRPRSTCLFRNRAWDRSGGPTMFCSTSCWDPERLWGRLFVCDSLRVPVRRSFPMPWGRIGYRLAGRRFHAYVRHRCNIARWLWHKGYSHDLGYRLTSVIPSRPVPECMLEFIDCLLGVPSIITQPCSIHSKIGQLGARQLF